MLKLFCPFCWRTEYLWLNHAADLEHQVHLPSGPASVATQPT
jgi:hypothetical protein